MKTPHCIMVFDTNLTDNWIAERIIKTYGIASEMKFAYDSENALNSLDEYYTCNGRFPELLLVDRQLQGISGFELINKIKNHDNFRNEDTKIALLTTVSEFTSDYNKIEEEEIDHVFLKPLDIQQIRMVL